MHSGFMRHWVISIICALGAIGVLQQAADAQARIAQFGAEHIIKADKTVVVTETIVLNIKGDAEHGLVRKFPTKMGVYGGKPAQYRVTMCFLDSKQFVAPSKSEGDSALVVLRTDAPLSSGRLDVVVSGDDWGRCSSSPATFSRCSRSSSNSAGMLFGFGIGLS